MLLTLRTLALSYWFGGGLGTMFATRAIFAAVEDRRQAGNLTGAILRGAYWGRLGWAVPFFVSALAPRGWSFHLGVLSFALAAVQMATDAQVRALRAKLAADESLRERFARLHGLSVTLLLLHVAAAFAALCALRPQ